MSADFRFKRFGICQRDSAMKVGTDGVLLGAWCTVRKGFCSALDIGTGTGLIAIMLAQRGEASGLTVDAIEIDTPSASEAHRNAGASPWRERITIINGDITDYAAGTKYDLIVSNPPYFERSLASPDKGRTVARHTDSLSHEDLVGCVSKLLSPDGLFAVVLPAGAAAGFSGKAFLEGLHETRRTEVWSTPLSGARRMLMEFSFCRPDKAPEKSKLIIQGTGMDYTTEYRELTRDFYLKF